MNAIEIEDLTHRFGARTALDQLSFAVARGSFTALLGRNGAGKSTLVALVTGLYAARSGRVQVFGHDLASARGAALSRLGVVFQGLSLDPELTVEENLVHAGMLHGLSRSEAHSAARRELERIGLEGRLEERVRALSGGLRRRAEIARALIHRPALLILDEASIGLDPPSRSALLAHVRGLVQDRGLTVLWATHLLDEIDPGDSVVVLAEGRLAWQGIASPQADFSQLLSVSELPPP